jgi:hypothetical protein
VRARAKLLSSLLVAVVVMLPGCSGESKPAAQSSESTTPTAADETDDSDAVSKDSPEGRSQLEIEIAEPVPFSSVHGSFRLVGTASVYEGALAWQILDESLKPMKRGMMTASCGAPCRGRYSTTVNLQGVEPGSWELHVFAPPVGPNDPPRMHDTILPITVTTGPVGDAPPADAPPPGGVPNA